MGHSLRLFSTVWGPVDWVGRVLPEAKFENIYTSFFEFFLFERPIARYLLKTILHCKGSRKITGAEEHCRQQGIAFIPVAAESLGGWHRIAVEQIKKLGSALARHTGQEEGEAISHLFSRCSLLLQRGLAALLLNRVPNHPAAELDGRI